jgi:hypothetical protein
MGYAQLLYVSRSLSPPATALADLARIFETARLRNETSGLTGCLAAWSGCFVQVLEGAPEAVEAAMSRIAADGRHADVTIRMRREIRSRSFPAWRMVRAGADVVASSVGDPMKTPAVVLLSELMRFAERGDGLAAG